MDNLTNEIVWVVRYSHPDLTECEGIFSTKEKALANVNEDFERYSDIWLNRTEEIDDEVTYFNFDLYDKILGLDKGHNVIIFPAIIR